MVEEGHGCSRCGGRVAKAWRISSRGLPMTCRNAMLPAWYKRALVKKVVENVSVVEMWCGVDEETRVWGRA